MIDSRCGLHCSDCSWKETHGCGGCIETAGHPFHGACRIAGCCQDRGFTHCGECGLIPCEQLHAFSYLDPEHGDKPPGGRVSVCRQWAAAAGQQAWSNVLLTSAGWIRPDGGVNEQIRQRFLEMLGRPASECRVLFIPTAATTDVAKRLAAACQDDLANAGIAPAHVTTHDIDGSLTVDQAMAYDVIYFTGGNTAHLLRRIKQTGFDAIIKRLVHANKVYVGVSAGSLIAAPNIGEPLDQTTSGLALIHAYLSVHQPPDVSPRTDLPLPQIPLTDHQALAVSWRGYELIED